MTPSTAFLHYSAPPVVGGVESVMAAHARLFLEHGYPVTVIAGEGRKDALPAGTGFERIRLLSSQHPDILATSAALEKGRVPRDFDSLVQRILEDLTPVVTRFDRLIVHNVFTKHFNLPLTAALFHLLDVGAIHGGIAWCHDFTWTSPHSGGLMRPGYPWDLLRTYRPDLAYVTISNARQAELAGLLGVDPETIRVIYNGIDPAAILGLSAETLTLARRLDLFSSDLILLMPVRITQAKNIEYAMRVTAALKDRGMQAPRVVVTGPPDPHASDARKYYRSLLALRRELGVQREFRFVYESGPDSKNGYTISSAVVGGLYRLADALFMPSHREGFGMPVLEAGLADIPVVASDAVPAARELGGPDAFVFPADLPPAKLARNLLDWLDKLPAANLKRRTRLDFTWEAIFQQEIRPLLKTTLQKTR